MKRFLAILFFFSLVCCGLAAPPAAHAQTQVVLGNAAVELTGPWKFHTGDSPQATGTKTLRWAAPDFDDSAWGTMDLTPLPGSTDPNSGASGFVPGWGARGYAGHIGYAWYRLRVNLQDNGQNPAPGANAALALKMPADVDDAYQVYVNGRLIGELGRFAPRGVTFYDSQPRAFLLPSDIRGGPLTIAIRVWMDASAPIHTLEYGGLHGPPVLGKAAAIDASLRLNWDAINRMEARNFLEIAVQSLALLIIFVLYWLDPSEPAYPWLALTCAISLVFVILIFVRSHTTWLSATSESFVLLVVLLLGQIGVWVHFWGAWFRLGRTRQTVWLYSTVWGVVVVLAATTAMLMPPLYGRLVPRRASIWLPPTIHILHLLVGVLLLWVAYLGIRKERTEGLLALPALLLLAIAYTPVQEWRPFGIPINRVATFVLLAIITVLMLRRFLQAQRRREQLRLEIEQARQVQSLLIPATAPNTPGFAVESVYLPASQVGGDFFQVQPGDDGSLLIVVGDVSGKGLKAAMTVSAIVGGLKQIASRKPAEVLAALNRQLLAEMADGFVTCCAALIEADGRLSLANAGHLPPYRNGRELPTEGGLPLGILAGSSSEEAHYQLAPGDRLTFVSDGVVEAANDQRELFGFERTQAISTQPANAIAEAAQRFGQKDDITVVTIQRAISPALAVV